MTRSPAPRPDDAAAEERLRAHLAAILPLDARAMAAAQAHLDRLTKPTGSLGRLEELLVTVAGITGRPDAPLEERHLVVAAGDHGVARRGVSAYPAEVTAQMIANFRAGGAAINVLAEAVGARLTVLDVGVAGPIPPGPAEMGVAETTSAARPATMRGRLFAARIADGTADVTDGPAMTRAQAVRAVHTGIDAVEELIRGPGLDVLGVGDMGIGNTTASSAIVAVLTATEPARVTGRGTGVDDDALRRKVAAVGQAIAVNRPDPADPIAVLAALGGFEIAAIAGLILGATARRVPVVLDGFVTSAAALVATALASAVGPRLIAAHRSPEPGHGVALDALGLRPYLDIGMRLGEGTGAALLIGLLAQAVRLRDQMATFDSAGISDRGVATPA